MTHRVNRSREGYLEQAYIGGHNDTITYTMFKKIGEYAKQLHQGSILLMSTAKLSTCKAAPCKTAIEVIRYFILEKAAIYEADNLNTASSIVLIGRRQKPDIIQTIDNRGGSSWLKRKR